jgi:prophage regulatory protein
MTERIIRNSEFMRRLVGISASSLWRYERNIPNFPKRRQLGPNTVGYFESEVQVYIESLKVVDNAA